MEPRLLALKRKLFNLVSDKQRDDIGDRLGSQIKVYAPSPNDEGNSCVPDTRKSDFKFEFLVRFTVSHGEPSGNIVMLQ
jgi:hypothetical protein